jgi:hypothetical protein
MEGTGVKGSRSDSLIGLATVVLLLVIVAVASTGSVPLGAGGTRRPADQLLDTLISLFMVLMVAGIGVWVYLLFIRKEAVAQAVVNRARRSPWVTLATFVVGFGLLALFVRWVSVDEGLRRRLSGINSDPARPARGNIVKAGDYQPEFATGPVLVVVALLAIAVAAWYVSYRARRRRLEPMPDDTLLPVLADVLDETLDDLRAETDPRRAVIAAYARMERALAASGLPRDPSEAPDEYLQRIFADLDVSRFATSRLTALFSWAKFSGRDVAPEMKQEAIEALEAVREELRAAEILAEEQRLAGVAERRQRAGV